MLRGPLLNLSPAKTRNAGLRIRLSMVKFNSKETFMIRTALFALALAASTSLSYAQGTAGGSQSGAATVAKPESGRVAPGTAASTLTPETSMTALTPNGTRVDTTVAPGGAVGASAPDATSAAPAGR